MSRASTESLPVRAPLGPLVFGPAVRTVTSAGAGALAGLLAGLALTAGLSAAGWGSGIALGAVLLAAFARGLARGGHRVAGPADVVTLARGILTCGAAGLTTDSLLGRPVTVALLVLTVPAVVLDAVDGRVARRTGTVSEFGGRFDGEVDALLMLVLSVFVATDVGWWVVAIGLARYAFGITGRALPWLRGQLDYLYWRKVVTATATIALTVAAAGVLPHWSSVTVMVLALTLVAESFGRDVWWLWRRRGATASAAGGRRRRGTGSSASAPPAGAKRRSRTVAAALDGAALLLLWFALLGPDQPDRFTPSALLRIPLEGVVVAGLVLLLPARWTRRLVWVVGTLLGVLTVLKILDLSAFTVQDRPFNLVTDRGQFGSGFAFVDDALGPWAAWASVILAALLAGAVVVLVPLASRRLALLATRHHRGSTRAVAGLAVAWVACAATGFQLAPGRPAAAADVGMLASDRVRAAVDALHEQRRFDLAVASDPLPGPAAADLTALRGKDVLVVFVESYGRVALEGPDAEPVRRLLDAGTARLRDSGFTARSAFLTSSTFGSSSWLAHATLQSGLWVDNQSLYDRLLSSRRTTLTSAFARAGWRTVALLPSNRGTWPEGRAFYRFAKVYDRNSLGYRGPKFGFSAVPDQFALAALARLELARPDRAPVMAEIELTSSHAPWAPLPTMVDWTRLGDGSVYDGIEAEAMTTKGFLGDRRAVPAAYRASIAYSLTSLIGFVERYGDDDLVVIALGDHQPSTVVSGYGARRDVPITLIAHDPVVIARIAAWGWQDGLRPGERAPVWPMDSFRDRFFTAYGPGAPSAGTPGRP